MKEIPQQPAQLLAGHAYTTEDSDQLGTFAPAWADFEHQFGFKTLDQLTKTPNRTALVVFSPYNTFIYWVGSLLPVDVKVPQNYECFKLPAATAGQVKQFADRVLMKELPLATSFNQGLHVIEQAGYPLPERLGQTDHPYYLESYRLNGGKVAEVAYRLYINPHQLTGVDEYE
ncbi:hypothetical protein HWN39_06170 [Lactobacillus rhamnosus]|uniref:AraC family transcriptional regulator n=1 Tax=Lacticaseibacillus rhamnosus TaxID=47715 RepID=A0A7Y7QFD1_LACRH|nr:hypothetical protein [Lacticaseibacillus rhamnosus]NVO88086.1 hypothetical protein [Lacticaseibacillus rhamnosus]